MTDTEYLTRSEWHIRGYRVDTCAVSDHRNKYGEATYAKHQVVPIQEHSYAYGMTPQTE